jgi:hypothetical protein
VEEGKAERRFYTELGEWYSRNLLLQTLRSYAAKASGSARGNSMNRGIVAVSIAALRRSAMFVANTQNTVQAP